MHKRNNHGQVCVHERNPGRKKTFEILVNKLEGHIMKKIYQHKYIISSQREEAMVLLTGNQVMSISSCHMTCA
jgi:hypothetical protein